MHYLQLELYKNIRNDLDLFDFIQNTALDGLWYWDLEQPENEWMNPKFWQVLGYDAEKMPHSPSAWQSLINAEDFKIAEQLIHKCISDPTKKYEQVLEYKHKKGHSVYIKCYGKIYCNSEGKPIRMLGAHVDVSETIKSEKKALSEANFLKQIYSTNSIYVLKTDLSGNYTYVNQHYIDFFSGGNNELIGTSVLHGLIPEDQIKCIEVGQSCINHPNKKFPIELTKRINGKRLTAA